MSLNRTFYTPSTLWQYLGTLNDKQIVLSVDVRGKLINAITVRLEK